MGLSFPNHLLEQENVLLFIGLNTSAQRKKKFRDLNSHRHLNSEKKVIFNEMYQCFFL